MPRGRVDSERVLTAAGLSELALLHKTVHWQLWKATLSGPIDESEQAVLTVNASCGWSHLRDARAELDRQRLKAAVTVVSSNLWTKALNQDELERCGTILQIRPTRVMTQSEFLFRVLHRALGQPVNVGQGSDDPGQRYFIEPSIHFPSEEDSGPAIKLLYSWLSGKRNFASSSRFGALLGDAGGGKSTVAKRLFDKLAQEQVRVIPLLIESRQWAELSARTWSDLSDIWAAAIRTCYPGAVVGPDRLEVFLASGTVIPILDGFDELCSRFPGIYNPSDTLDQLLGLCDEGQFLLTSRTRFWEEHIQPGRAQGLNEIQLESFTTLQRDQYIEKRYPASPRKAETARQILERIRQRTRKWGRDKRDDDNLRQFDTIPFVVMLATESADTKSEDLTTKFGDLLSSTDPLEGLVLAFCAREEVRQKITLDEQEQVGLLKMLASEFGEIFDRDDVHLAISVRDIEDPGKVSQEILRNDLLEQDRAAPEAEAFRFKFPFIYEYFIAKTICDSLSEDGANGANLAGFRKCASRQGSLLEATADLLKKVAPEPEYLLRNRWEVVRRDPEAATGFVHVAIALARLLSSTKREAAGLLDKMVGGVGQLEIAGIALGGTIGGLDFSGFLFTNCSLENVEFVNCIFDQGTRFSSVQFRGGLVVNGCEGFGASQFHQCSFSERARATVQVEQEEQNRFEITPEQIKAGIRDVLGRFRRGPGFKTRRRDGIERSIKNRWVFGGNLLDALIKCAVLAPFEAHGNDMLRVEDTSRATTFLDNGTCLGSVREAVARLRQELVK